MGNLSSCGLACIEPCLCTCTISMARYLGASRQGEIDDLAPNLSLVEVGYIYIKINKQANNINDHERE